MPDSSRDAALLAALKPIMDAVWLDGYKTGHAEARDFNADDSYREARRPTETPFTGYDENGVWISAAKDEYGNIVPPSATESPRNSEVPK